MRENSSCNPIISSGRKFFPQASLQSPYVSLVWTEPILPIGQSLTEKLGCWCLSKDNHSSPPETWHIVSWTKLRFVGKEETEVNNNVSYDHEGRAGSQLMHNCWRIFLDLAVKSLNLCKIFLKWHPSQMTSGIMYSEFLYALPKGNHCPDLNYNMYHTTIAKQNELRGDQDWICTFISPVFFIVFHKKRYLENVFCLN